jgi:hypothetical protein
MYPFRAANASDLALGKQPEVDITPFAARRFDATPWWRAFRAFA